MPNRPSLQLLLYLGAIVLCAAGTATFVRWLLVPNEPTPAPTLCRGHSGKFRFHLESRLYINQRFHPPEKREEVINTAIHSQLRFLQAKAIATRNVTLRWFSKSYGQPEIRVLSVKETNYPLKLIIDPVADNDWDISPYMQQARAAGETQTSDPALEVTYEAKHTVALCTEDPIPNTIDVDLPSDPELAYWFIPHPKRIKRKWAATHAESITNPCAHEEIADLPWPTAYWYFWDPHRKDAAQSIDCTELLKPGAHILRHPLKLSPSTQEEAVEIQADAFGLNTEEPLKVALFFSLFRNKVPEGQTHAPFQNKQVPELLDTFLTEDNFEKVRTRLHSFVKTEIGDDVDPSLIAFLKTLWAFRDWIEVETFSTESDHTYLRAILKGRFKHSQRAVFLDLQLSATSPGNKYGLRHLARFLEALDSADVVAYKGHSEMGGVFTKQALLEAEAMVTTSKEAQNTARKSYQIVLLDSCFSYQYYHPDNFRMPGSVRQNFVRDYIYTGTRSDYNAASLAQALLRLLDLQFAGANSTSDTLLDLANLDNLVVFERNRATDP